MFVLVCYDVDTRTPAGAKRLRKIATACKDYGVRVQYSIFECRLSPANWVVLRNRLMATYTEQEDSLRFYFLEADAAMRTEHHGVREPLDVTGPLII